jgi:hypothetical protein
MRSRAPLPLRGHRLTTGHHFHGPTPLAAPRPRAPPSQALLAGLVPPLAQTAAVEDEAGSEWRPSAEAVEVQGQVLEAVEKVGS